VDQDFEIVGDHEFEVATFQLGQTLVGPQPLGKGDPSQLGPGMGGAHRLSADQPVGLQVMGYGFATSYQYPGGLDLRGIAPPLPPLK
jgi:hypothetical protein